MKLLTESIESLEFLKESVDGEKQYFIQGIFMQANVRNKNGRVYPLDILAKEVLRYNRDEINENRALGELGHPQGPTINLDKVSHKIISLEQKGTNFIGKAIILDTDNGIKVKRLMDAGVKLAVSSRGIGTLKRNGGADRVQEDFILATPADIVHNPSAPNAFVQNLHEAEDWMLDHGVWRRSSDILFEEGILRNFEDFMDNIE